MKVVDANVLLYAVDEDAEHHGAAKGWLDRAISSGETVVLPWVCLLAFLRLATHPAVYEHPLTVDEAVSVAEVWLSPANVVTPEPDARHLLRLRAFLSQIGRGGNLVNDAHIAAIAAQFDAVVGTFDSDFGRFAGIRWERPS
ncbi:MAG: PIN domain-containing protein [Microbacteriaceae bacterium]